MNSSVRSLFVRVASLLFVTVTSRSTATAAFEHGFDTVGDMLWGWLGPVSTVENLTEHQKTFYANTYNVVVVGGGTFRDYNSTPPDQWPVAVGVRELKKLNPNMKVLLYEATGFGPLGWGNSFLKDHPEFWLKDDNGKVYYRIVRGKEIGPSSFDWRIPSVREWWDEQSFIFKQGTFDGLLVDGAGASQLHLDPINHTMSVEHQKDLAQAKMYMLGNASKRWAEQGGIVASNPVFDYGLIGNPQMEAKDLFPLEYHWKYVTGALDEMYGGFGTLNKDGSFNITKMASSIEGMLNMSRQGKTVLVRGYPGPCSVPFASVPTSAHAITVPNWPNNSQPNTTQGLKEAASKLLDLALAPFLLVAEPNIWFSYSWFYGMNSGWVTCPSEPNTCAAPDDWYPEFKRRLGKPLGAAVRHGNVYTRQFEHASVYVDLVDRTASKVTWLASEGFSG